MVNESIRAAFERMWGHVKSYVNDGLAGKASKNHVHEYAPYTHSHFANEIYAGTFSGYVRANANGQANVGDSCLRNTKLVSTDTTPTVNGEINWTYK